MDGFQTKTPKRPNLDYPHGDVRPELAEAIQVAPGIEWVSMPLPFSLKFINLWLIDDGDSWTIVDTGMPLKETRDAWKALLDARVTPEKPLKRVMVTHMHPDHAGGAHKLRKLTGAKIAATSATITIPMPIAILGCRFSRVKMPLIRSLTVNSGGLAQDDVAE